MLKSESIMAGKKKEGLGALKPTSGGHRRDDRQAANKNVFEPITIDATNAVTVIYMLQSPEDNVVLRAIASLEHYARKAEENMKLLCSLGIFQYLLQLLHNHDNIIKRFTHKLIGMLCSLEEFREQMFTVDNILETFVEILEKLATLTGGLELWVEKLMGNQSFETKPVSVALHKSSEKETDAVMHEYSALTLAELSGEYQAASYLLKIERCIETLFLRITSPDPDVEKNCLDVMNHLLNDVYGIEAFIESPGFSIKPLLDLTSSRYPVIQTLAIEVLKQLTSWCRDTRVLFAFRDALGIETILGVLENVEWLDLHASSLELLMNVVDSPELCDYLLQSGCLSRLVKLLEVFEEDKKMLEKILGVLARMSQTRRGRLALHSLEIEQIFCSYLKESSEGIQESSCLGIANMAHHRPCLNSILEQEPIPILLEILSNPENNISLRNMAAYALNILCNEDRKAAEALLSDEKFEAIFLILLDDSERSVDLCRNLIQVFIGISLIDDLRVKIIGEYFMSVLLSCIQSNEASLPRDASVQVDALECLSGYLVECEARALFTSLNGAKILINCLNSKYASVREWAGHLIVEASLDKNFVKSFLRRRGLQWLLAKKTTRYSMPSWHSAIEAIFAAFLPAKFAFTGRLDFQDITQEGFYLLSNPRFKFLLVDELLEAQISPVFPIYVANFKSSSWMASPSEVTESSSTQSHLEVSHQDEPQEEAAKTMDAQDVQKYMKGADRNSSGTYSWDGSVATYESVGYKDTPSEVYIFDNLDHFVADPYLSQHLENLKKKIAKETSFGDVEWASIHPYSIRERAGIIGRFVAEEMTGLNPSPWCARQNKEVYVNEIKFHLGTNIIPLGFIRAGDFLERAMLFKVLADRIGFPCALVRGSYGRAWIEIAVPVINIEDLDEPNSKDEAISYTSNSDTKLSSKDKWYNGERGKSHSESQSICSESSITDDYFCFPKLRMDYFKAFPGDYLKPNAIVDLMYEPGKIINLNSREAEEYCGAFLFDKKS